MGLAVPERCRFLRSSCSRLQAMLFRLVVGSCSWPFSGGRASCFIPFSWFLVPESIHWLVSMRRHGEAEKLIRLGCRLNGIILPSDFQLDKPGRDDEEGSDDEATGNGYHGNQPRKSAVERLRSTQLNLKNRPGTGEYLQHEFHAHIGEWRKILDLMKNHQLRRHFFIVSYMWAIVGFLYYGLTASTMVMKGNVYLNYCLSGLVMIPASVSIFILRRFGRKKPIFYFLIGAGIFIILSVTCPYKTPDGVDMYPVYLAIKLMAKYCVVSCLISIRLLIIELFPTPVRGTLIGLTAFIGLLGSAFGYYFLELITFSKWVGVVVGALTLLAAALSRLLPETSHRPLPDTINDMMAACREMFLNLLVAMPNMPRPEEPAPTPQPRPKRNMSALSAFSAVLSWRSRSKSSNSCEVPARSMSDEDFKRAPHAPLSSMTSAPLPHDVADDAPRSHRGPSLREKLARALSQRRHEAKLDRGIDNPEFEADAAPARVSFDLVRADSQGVSVNGLEPPERPGADADAEIL
ncbi:organic cation transporter-like protein [Pollicipes pollicipes]|uniref:organic cation transporter-like protein n=1 Tax=Pollicipes pollicipes TaxID=41117 RepID=UPI0018854EDF|nr:organic cation transporter-like protein [Pollicipes pollicipes]